MVTGFGRGEERGRKRGCVDVRWKRGDHFRSKLGIVSSFVPLLVINEPRERTLAEMLLLVAVAFFLGRKGKEETPIKHTLSPSPK